MAVCSGAARLGASGGSVIEDWWLAGFAVVVLLGAGAIAVAITTAINIRRK